MEPYNYNKQLPIQTQIQDSDKIEHLPVNSIKPTEHELSIINNLFNQEKSNLIKNEYTDVIFILVMYILISFPYVDTLLSTYFPIQTENPFITYNL
jgi:hypothetical protein